jgi:hypothetical protein
MDATRDLTTRYEADRVIAALSSAISALDDTY